MIDLPGALIVWLRPRLTGVDIAGRVPRILPVKFLLVRRIGGVWDWPAVDQPTIETQAWAATDTLAYKVAQDTQALIHSLQGSTLGGAAVYLVEEFAGPQNFPDPERENHPRFVATYSIRHRENLAIA
jgi:hypothetical protein